MEINDLLNQFRQMQRMMKQMSSGQGQHARANGHVQVIIA
jgi:signal recognition particle GTPase